MALDLPTVWWRSLIIRKSVDDSNLLLAAQSQKTGFEGMAIISRWRNISGAAVDCRCKNIPFFWPYRPVLRHRNAVGSFSSPLQWCGPFWRFAIIYAFR